MLTILGRFFGATEGVGSGLHGAKHRLGRLQVFARLQDSALCVAHPIVLPLVRTFALGLVLTSLQSDLSPCHAAHACISHPDVGCVHVCLLNLCEQIRTTGR